MTRTTIPISAISTEAQQQLKSSQVYNTIDDLPLSGNDQGSTAYVASTKRLYIWDSGWYNIALINTTPSITGGNESSYLFETDGTPIEITLVGSDPEGIPLTWSYEVTSGSLTNGGGTTATVSNVDNVFTITPSTTESYAGSFSLTFKASDGINLATAVSSFTLAFKVLNSNYTTLLAKGIAATQNSTFIDSSTNNHTITANGDVYQGTFSPYRQGGYSMYFDGTGDYLSIPASLNFAFQADYTIEAWIYLSSSADFTLVDTTGSGGNSQISMIAGALYHGGVIPWTHTAFTQNTWTHIAFSRQGNSLRLFQDGILQSTQTISTTIGSSANAMTIGARNDMYYPFNGYISNLRIVKGTAVYTSNFTPPTAPLEAITNTSLLINTPYIADSSSNAHAITVNGNTSTKPFSPFDYKVYDEAINGGSAYFDGSVNLTLPSVLPITQGVDFTLEFWFYQTVGAKAGLVGQYINTDGGRTLIYIESSLIRFFQAGSNRYDHPMTINRWYHVAMSRVGSTFYALVDGKLVSTWSSTTNITNTNLIIGQYGGTNSYTGYISDVYVTTGSAKYTTDYTVPSSPVITDANTELKLNFTNAGIQDYNQVSNLRLVGNATGSNTQTKNASYSMYFDGGGDYIVASEEEFGSSDLTWEMWINTTSSTQYATLYSRTPAGFGSGMWTLMINQSSATAGDVAVYMADYSGAAPMLLTTGANVRDGAWHHIAVVRNGSSWVLYVDGTSRATQTWAGAIADIAGSQYIGYDQNYGRAYTGYIEDFRITKGLARYTANFTPPTSELLG